MVSRVSVFFVSLGDTVYLCTLMDTLKARRELLTLVDVCLIPLSAVIAPSRA